MHARSLVLLFAAVAALVALTFWQLRREDEQGAQVDAPLLEGFERSRVKAVRIDNLERSLQLRLERTSQGRWMIVDPIEFPVEAAVLEALFSSLETQRLRPPLVEDLAKVGLAPPRVVLELTEEIDGRSQLTRIEVGAVDIGEQLVYARRDGRLGRTERALDTVLERDLPDWRAHYVMSFDPRSVVELSREGRMELAGEAPLPVELRAVLDGEWRATAPFQAQLDARAVGGLINAIATLRAEAFIDAPGPLDFYGLERPAVRLSVTDASGVTQSVRLSPEPQGEMWYAKREDQPYIYRVSSMSAGMCFPPSQGFVEANLARVARSEVTGLEWTYEGRSVSLALSDRAWRATGREGERVVLDAAVADESAVADALALVEQARLGGIDFARDLTPEQVRGRLVLRLRSGEVAGDLGAAVRTPDGVQGVEFRRDGDHVVGLLGEELLALVRRDASSFQSLVLHKLLELDVSFIEIEHQGRRRKWLRDDHGHWIREGLEGEAKEFSRWVDRLLSMRASSMLQRGAEEPHAPLTVSLVTFRGQTTSFALGLRPGAQAPSTHVYRSDSQYAVVGAEPYTSLVALMVAD